MRTFTPFLLLLLLTPGVFAKPLSPGAKKKAASLQLAPGFTGADLERLRVGNQAGLLKIQSPDGPTPVFKKNIDSTNVEAIDSVNFAPVKPTDRDAIAIIGTPSPPPSSSSIIVKISWR